MNLFSCKHTVNQRFRDLTWKRLKLWITIRSCIFNVKSLDHILVLKVSIFRASRSFCQSLSIAWVFVISCVKYLFRFGIKCLNGRITGLNKIICCQNRRLRELVGLVGTVASFGGCQNIFVYFEYLNIPKLFKKKPRWCKFWQKWWNLVTNSKTDKLRRKKLLQVFSFEKSSNLFKISFTIYTFSNV